MRAWLRSQWRALEASYDQSEALAGSQPAAVAIAAGTLAVLLAVIGYLPPLARASRFEQAWLSLALTGLGAATTLVAWRRGCQGRLGTLATLLDNGFYSAALVHAAVNTHGGYGMGLAGAHGLMVLAFPARAYALTLPFALVMAWPVAVGLAVYRPASTVAVILITSYIMTLLMAFLTGSRRELLRKQVRLTQACGAASRVADESVQAALASTLLSLGHFLHELKNYQTAVSANLAFVQQSAALDDATREALADACTAQESEQKLVRQTIETLQRRANANDAAFELFEVIREVVAATPTIQVLPSPQQQRFTLRGVADHLQGVLGNLIRNSEQADARVVHIDVSIDPGGRAATVSVHDDGHGIEAELLPRLFEPFVGSNKSGGTGLGLYLCRRYVELFGGTIEAGDGPLGGAAFVIRLPGEAAPLTEAEHSDA